MGKCISKPNSTLHKSPIQVLEALHIRRENFRKFYQIQEKLSENSYSSIFLVTDKATGDTRAIKSIQVSNHKLSSLFHEVENLQRLDHPHIIKVFEAFIEVNYLQIVTEYCSGGELLERISSRMSFSEHQASVYMQQMTSALVYLHQNGIVHRNLGPDTVLFLSPNEEAPVKLVNLSKVVPNDKAYFFLSPESLAGEFVPNSDIWSLGLILYLMLSGSLPFPDTHSSQEHFLWLQTQEIQFSGKAWRNVSDEAKVLIQNMLARDNKKRFTAEQVYQDRWMEKYLTDQRARKLSRTSLKKMADYSKKSKFKRALLSFMMTKISVTDDIQRLMKVFKTTDANADGELTVEEILNSIKEADVFVEEPMRLVQAMNVNERGFVTYSEFVTAFVDWKKELSGDRLRKVFKEVDKNGDGVISPQEFVEVLRCKYTEKELKKLMTEADTNGDGFVDFNEFCQFLQ